MDDIEIEKLRDLLCEAANHIDGTTGARSRPNSDSGELVARIDLATNQKHLNGWQPISAVPTGSTLVMVFQSLGTWTGGYTIHYGKDACQLSKATHWRPLPESPAIVTAPHTHAMEG